MKNILRFLSLAVVAVMLCLSLASCGAPNSNPDVALGRLKNAGVFASKSESFIEDIPGIECVVSGTGIIDGEGAMICIIYFEKKSDAEDAWEQVEKVFEQEDSMLMKESGGELKRSGKIIYYGTENAIKAAK